MEKNTRLCAVHSCYGILESVFSMDLITLDDLYLSVCLSFCLSLAILYSVVLANFCTYLGDQLR